MRNLSSTFRRNMFYGKRNYDYKAIVTLADNTVLTLNNTKLWSGGFNWDDAISDDNTFTALGSAIIGSASLTIDNMSDAYSDYNFTNAKVELSLSMTYELDGVTTPESIKIGKYTVDSTEYNGALITLNMLDNMEQFDRPYDSSRIALWPARLDTIIIDACQRCGVTLNTYTFPHYNYSVAEPASTDGVTYRDVISWVATIAGCFARCNVDGQLELKWFDTNVLESIEEGFDGGVFDSSSPYSTGDNVDGGSFNPWNTGANADGGEFSVIDALHYIGNLYSQNIGVDDVVITGVEIIVEEAGANGNLSDVKHLFGTNDYTIQISGNKFITVDNYNEIGTWLSNQIVGLRFRNANVTHLNDPSIEAGDIGIVIDRKENHYPILITRTNFVAGSTQTTVCGAESALRNSATRFSEATRAYVDARQLLNREQTRREQAVQALNQALAAKSGLYSTQETASGGGTIYYLHDKPLLDDSDVVWKMTAEAWAVTTNYDGDDTVWNAGMTVNGDVIARILNAIGVNANWIRTGALIIETDEEEEGVASDQLLVADATNGSLLIQAFDTNGNETFYLDSVTGTVRINASSFKLSGTNFNNAVNGLIDSALQNLDISSEVASQLTAANLYPILFPNNQQGVVLQNGKLYINWEHAYGGTLTLGGDNNQHGTLVVKNFLERDAITLDGGGLKVDTPNYGYIHLYNRSKYLEIEGDTITAYFKGAPQATPQTICSLELCRTNYNTNYPDEYGNDNHVVFNGAYFYFPYGLSILVDSGETVSLPLIYLSSFYNDSAVTTYAYNVVADSNYKVRKAASSSRRYKNISRELTSEDVKNAYNIKVYMASYKEGYLQKDDARNGVAYPMFIAEQVHEQMPIATDNNKEGQVENWNERVIIPIMFQMIKDQKETLDEQQKTIEAQNQRISDLEARLAALEALLN